MKTTVTLPRAAVQEAIVAKLRILERKRNNEPNALIKEIVEKEIAEYTTAMATLTETK